ncbi:hypothetical protein [Amycolatopsis sp. FDAARGOS 1241]|uniref:hypothetical protein n=1 Tax=Amycolatopsis sp. FDAARGOS 1241 TaxID=2778070 RepID=UPI00195182E2|nr:hypothetical protein [Amycolatopsis sp. FDAARGOS 1241]QRP50353.1 hypothetical protein I6J71_23290 [Amycolatopsis sp. FDAARGOS 1241]
MTSGTVATASGLAIVGDGSASGWMRAHEAGAVLAELESDAGLLRAHTALNPQAVAVAARDEEDLAAAIRALPAGISTIFLARTEPGRARAVQRDLAREGCSRIITEQDTRAIALVAMTLVSLRRRAVAPFNARVVVTGSPAVPVLLPLLMACGVGDISSWRTEDARAFPLSVIARDVDAVIDLAGAAADLDLDAGVDVISEVLAAGDPVAHLLALPGLVRALGTAPVSEADGAAIERFGVHRATAHALASLTPVDRMLPDLADPDLTTRVARAVSEALAPPPFAP